MKILSSFFSLVFFTLSAFPQSCLPEGITFSNQNQIDSFQTDYPGCTEIVGNVSVDGADSDITNLNGLNVLTTIGGSLVIKNTNSLNNLSGLEKLSYIGNNLYIGDFTEGNYSLVNIDSLYNLKSIGGTLYIYDNPVLRSIEGLFNLTAIGWDLIIWDNDALSDLTGLNNIKSVGGGYTGLHIYYNDMLINLNGLNNLEIIHGQLYVSHNSSLVNFSGLNNLTSVENHVIIYYNNSLINFTGLENLTEVSRYTRPSCPGKMEISNNDNLIELTGLNNLDSVFGALSIVENGKIENLEGLNDLKYIQGRKMVGEWETVYEGLEIRGNELLMNIDGIAKVNLGSIKRVDIINNPLLFSCAVQSICNYLVAPIGEVTIKNNDTGCDSRQEVEEACASSVNEVSTLYGIKTQPNPFTTSTDRKSVV